jgi:hypothetical protein
MTTPEQARSAEPRSAHPPSDAGGPIALIILAILCGAAAFVLTVFGVWPAAILIAVSVALAWLAKYLLRKAGNRAASD